MFNDDIRDTYQELVGMIGRENFYKLVEHYGGQPIYIPSKKRIGIQTRNRRIYDDYRNGKTTREIARQLGKSESLIVQIIREQKTLHRGIEQHELFS